MQLLDRETGFAPGRLDRITDHLRRNYIEPGKIAGCQVLVARHGQVAYEATLGLADRERQRPLESDAVYRIYSMTKPITSVALMTLYEQGYFQLNDRVDRFIPAWRNLKVWESGEGDDMKLHEPPEPMTMRQMLSHTAGLTYGATAHPVDRAYRRAGLVRTPALRREDSLTLESFVDTLAGVPLRYDPGTRWMYSYSTDICGYLVQAISGMKLDAYLQHTIFDPLDMRDTGFSVSPREAYRLTANYQRQPDKSSSLIDDPERSTYLRPPAFLSGGGGLVSTMADYFRFAEMLRRGGELDGARIIGPRTLALMTRNHLPGPGRLAQLAMGQFSETAYDGVGFGLGFATTLDEVEAGTVGAGDFYWGGAASTIFWVDPREDLVAIFMTQLMPSATFNFRGQLKSIVYGAIEG